MIAKVYICFHICMHAIGYAFSVSACLSYLCERLEVCATHYPQMNIDVISVKHASSIDAFSAWAAPSE